jgi:hypothetical protein
MFLLKLIFPTGYFKNRTLTVAPAASIVAAHPTGF